MRKTTEERTEGENPNPGSDVANRYFSVAVTPTDLTSSLLALTATEGASDTNSYNYLRLGAPDDALEGKLPPKPNKPQERGAGGASSWKDGFLLYTTGKYQLATPSSSKATADDLEVVTDGESLYSAKYTTTEGLPAAILGGTAVSYAHMNQLTELLGTSLSTTFGLQQTFWTGTRVVWGVGSQLTGTIGTEIQLGATKRIELSAPNFMRMHHLGSTIAAKEQNVLVPGVIRLSSDAGNGAVTGRLAKAYRLFRRASALAAAAAPATFTLATETEDLGTWAGSEDEDKLKKSMIHSRDELATLLATFTTIQAIASLAAVLTRWESIPKTVAANDESGGSAMLRLENTDSLVQSVLKVGNRWITFGTDRNITIRNKEIGGEDPPMISIGADSIRLSVGKTFLSLNAKGIVLSGEKIIGLGASGSLALVAEGAQLAGTEVEATPTNAMARALAEATAAEIIRAAASAAAENEGLAVRDEEGEAALAAEDRANSS